MKPLRLAVYSAAHFAVDFSCALLMLGSVCRHDSAWTCILLYNFFAFAVQMPLGLLADRTRSCRLWASGGCLAVCAAFFLPALPASICAGLGNAAFHIGGGLDTLRSHERIAPLGIFVSPGALGIFAGSMAAQAELPVLSGAAVSALFALIVWGLCFGPARRPAQDAPLLPGAGAWLSLACLFAVVVLRSTLGLTLQFSWKTGVLSAVFVLCVALGKAFGGFAADRIGLRRAAAVTLGLSALLFVLSGWSVFGLAAVFFFNATMPMTLFAASRLLPGAKGFSFGLLTFALFLGFLPVHLGMTASLYGGASYAALAAVSLPLLLLGLRRVNAR